ncbi:MAG: ABC transporter permease [Limisphaerales bacterium]
MNRLLSDYGMVFVLVALCALFSVLTLNDQTPQGSAALAELVDSIDKRSEPTHPVIAVGAVNTPSADLATQVTKELQARGYSSVQRIIGTPRDLRLALDATTQDSGTPPLVVASGDVLQWKVLESLAADTLISPQTRRWPDFLKRTNLLAIVDRIVVIAVIAIGMTLVIITAGIDLSVGSLIALSAVVGTLLMKHLGGQDAPPWVVGAGFLAGTLSCGVIGAAGGMIVARFKVAPFITTLAIRMMARGFSFMITGGFSIYQVPKSLPWLGQGTTLGIPNTVLLLILLYAAAHLFMAHTRMGRYIYAVGGNEEAARLSGVPVGFVLVFVYTISALTAGLGGCIQASQLNTGTPNLGTMYELYVIAAVVVGGTSLAGGSGRILGTLIGAFIISVIQNGMNLLGMESYTQQVVLGAVILGAVLLDKVRSGGQWPAFLRMN